MNAKARGSISEATTRRLWALAGGRCEYHGCNKYLLEDGVTGYKVNFAERAHIVGATDAPGSPRGNHPLGLAERDQINNLMLLCFDHHNVIDELVDEHGVDALLGMKRVHEERIRLVTGLQEDAGTAVIRVVGGIRGAPVAVARDTVAAAVRSEGRFPRFPLAIAGEDLEIDLRRLPDEGRPDYWLTGERIIAAQTARIRDAHDPIRHLSIFALTRMPLLVALGYHLDDKIPTEIYGRRRDGTGDGGWGYDPAAAAVDFEVRHLAGPTSGPKVAVVASVTAPIGADVVDQLSDHTVYEIAAPNNIYRRDLLGARASLQAFADAYTRLLGRVEADHRDCEVIDLYPAAPVPAAVQLGRGVMREAQPALRVHDRDRDGHFTEALTLGGAYPQL